MFALSADPKLRLIITTLSGFMTVEEVTDLVRQEQALVAGYGFGDREFNHLVDAEELAVQSQPVAATFAAALESVPLKAKRVAVLRGSMLANMQQQRVLQIKDNAAIFSDRAEAIAWLGDPLAKAA